MTICFVLYTVEIKYWVRMTIYICIYTRPTLGTGGQRVEKSADTTQKGVSALAKIWRLIFYGNETLFSQGYPW